MVNYQLSCIVNVTFFFFSLHAWQTLLETFHHGIVRNLCPKCLVSRDDFVISFLGKKLTPQKQGGNRRKYVKQILKIHENHSLLFQKYDI